MNKFWNETTKNIDPYVPGEQPQDKKYIKLNTNENPYPPSHKVIESMNKAVNEDLKLYPDPCSKKLVNAIANFYNLNEDQIFVGNGSDEVLALSFLTFFSKDKKVLFPDISYSFYIVYAKFFNVSYEEISVTDNFEIDLDKFISKEGGVILPNPNAPTSKFISTQDLEKLLIAKKDSIVIIDEAYIDFGGESMAKFINKYHNLLVVQTFSKSRNLAGIRVGFAMGNKELIEGLNRVKNSFNSYTLDRVAQAGACAAIEDKEYFEETRNKIIKTREKSAKDLKSLGFHVLDSKSNFLFVSHKNIPGAKLYEELKSRGVLVRHFSNPKIDNYLRITIGTDKEMDTLINTIREILK